MGDNLEWHYDGACTETDPDVFTPFEKPLNTRNDSLPWVVARGFCKGDEDRPACPSLAQCRTWSMRDADPVPMSMAGGRTPKERKTLRRLIRQADAMLEAAS